MNLVMLMLAEVSRNLSIDVTDGPGPLFGVPLGVPFAEPALEFVAEKEG